jgi:hypothetical protein
MLVAIFVHMSLLNMLIYIYVLCVPVAIYMYFNVLKYRNYKSVLFIHYLSCINARQVRYISDILKQPGVWEITLFSESYVMIVDE